MFGPTTIISPSSDWTWQGGAGIITPSWNSMFVSLGEINATNNRTGGTTWTFNCSFELIALKYEISTISAAAIGAKIEGTIFTAEAYGAKAALSGVFISSSATKVQKASIKKVGELMAEHLFKVENDCLSHAALVGFRGHEELSHPFAIDVFVTLPDVSELDAVLGTKLTLSFELPPAYTIVGVVSEVEILHEMTERSVARLRVVPRLSLLALSHHCRMFTGEPITDIIETVLTDAGLSSGTDFELRLVGSYEAEEHVCQYNESDFDFISRWMEHEGIYYSSSSPMGWTSWSSPTTRAPTGPSATARFVTIRPPPKTTGADKRSSGLALGARRARKAWCWRTTTMATRAWPWTARPMATARATATWSSSEATGSSQQAAPRRSQGAGPRRCLPPSR